MIKDKYKIYELGNVNLLSGEILLSAKLAYQTYGSLNKKKITLWFCQLFLQEHI